MLTSSFLRGYHVSSYVIISVLLVIYTMNVLSGAESAEEEFKEVLKSYEAIKHERKNNAN